MVWDWDSSGDWDSVWESAGGGEFGWVWRSMSDGGKDNGESDGERGTVGKRKGGPGGSGSQSTWSWILVMLIGRAMTFICEWQ